MDIQTAQFISSNFAVIDRDRLTEILNSPSVHMSYSTFLSVKSFFNNIQHRAPSVGELIFFDAFVGSISDDLNQYAVTDVCTNDQHMAETLADIMMKYSAEYPNYNFPCTVSKTLELGISSLEKRSERLFSESEKRLFAAKSNESAMLKAILSGFSPERCQNGICVGIKSHSPLGEKELKSGKEYAVIIIYGNNDSFDKLSEFAKILSKNKKILRVVSARGKNIFEEILKTTSNISLNTDLLPLTLCDQDDILPYERTPLKILAATEVLFTESGFGQHAIAVFAKKRDLKSICNAAEAHGLKACAAVTVTKDHRFRMLADGYVASDLNSDIFKSAQIAQNIKIILPDQLSDQSAASAIVSDKTVNDLYPFEHVYFSKATVADNKYAFNTAVTSVISPFVSMAYDGINTQNSELSLAIHVGITFSGNKPSEDSYASLLGLYRAITELGIPVEDVSLVASDSDTYVSVALRAYRFGEKAEFITKLSKEELTDSFWKNEILPDFEAIRSLINGKSHKP